MISSDFYAVYQSAGKKPADWSSLLPGAHPQALRAGPATRTPPRLAYWTAAWLERVKDLYAAHAQITAAWAHGRDCITLHLPRQWHRQHDWLNLYRAACGTPARAA